MIIRTARDSDLPSIHAIYRHYVLTSLATFEFEPPSIGEMAVRREGVLAAGMPYIVAERDGEVVGYAHAGPYRPRPAYRRTVEDSLYVRADCARQGVGRALLGGLLEACEACRMRQMIAVIGDRDNAGSTGLHERMGFQRAGLLRGVGFKFDRWVDVVLMQRQLGRGEEAPPETNPGARGGGVPSP